MRVSIKFSDLRKIEDNNDYLKEKVEDLNLKLDCAIANEKKLISDIKQKDAEIEELKKIINRKHPKFWFGDRVGNKNEDFITDTIFYFEKSGEYYYSSIDTDDSIAESELEAVDEKI